MPDDVAVTNALAEVLTDVMTRRAMGEALTDESVIASHPHLAQYLRNELAILAEVRQAQIAADRAGSIGVPLIPLSADDLEKPLEADDNRIGLPDPHLTIRGYQLRRQLSIGGQAVVFLAVHEGTGRQVAVKVLRGGPFISSQARSRFDREVESLAKLNHPNIVQVLDRGRTADGSFFLAMEYVDGLSLDDYAAQAKDLDAVLRMFAKVCDAVDEAHRCGIVHRDLKPSNIRVDARGEPHVLDFGLARHFLSETGIDVPSPITLTGQIVGSLPWASPEQAAGPSREVTPSSDIYALGVMLYHAVTGQWPYEVSGPFVEVLRNIEKVVPRRPSRIARWGDAVDEVVDAVVLRALAKRPADRYRSAAEFRDALIDLADGRRPAIPLPRPEWHRSRLVGWTVSIGAIALAVGSMLAIREIQNAGLVRVVGLPQFSNSVGVTLVKIPEGIAVVGSPFEEHWHTARERQWREQVGQFWIGTTEVTRAQYEAVMGKQDWPAGMATLPADNVSFDDAQEFCRRLSEREGKRYRLPTEAEWEYACRAGISGPFNGNGDLPSMAWYSENSGGVPHPVATLQPNHWGLYDMLGNVQEWTVSHLALVDAAGVKTVYEKEWRVVRGGWAESEPGECRSAVRSSLRPDSRYSSTGFRVVMSVD